VVDGVLSPPPQADSSAAAMQAPTSFQRGSLRDPSTTFEIK
jgi:hypothetical protein